MEIDWNMVIANGIEAVPKKFRDKIANVAILLEDEPSLQVRKEQELDEDETLLGLYQGIPLSERGDGYGIGETMPDTITLYKRPICEEAGNDMHRVQQVVTETIWHEFGHYFGLDEDEVEKREKKKFSTTV